MSLLKIVIIFCIYMQNISFCQKQNTTSNGSVCTKVRTMKLTLNSWVNQTGDWEDMITAHAVTSNGLNYSNVHLIHTVEECNGERQINIKGLYNTLPTENEFKGNPKALPIENDIKVNAKVQGQIFDKLLFHHICGKGVFVIDNGRTLRKKSNAAYYYVSGFTHRPLHDNEVFQVRLNAVNGNSVEIGVMKNTPENVTMLKDMAHSTDTWIFYKDLIYQQGSYKTRDDGIQLMDMLVGETVGVMRDASGNLHLIFDGTDVGVAASGVPPNVYGIFEFFQAAPRATIDYSYHYRP